MHTHDLLEPQKYLRAFYSIFWVCHSSVFILFLLLLVQLFPTVLAHCNAQQLPLIVFDKHPWRKGH